jgi:hypothetical protein
MENRFERGSEWRQWGLHVHTPASFHWNGPRLTGNLLADAALIDQMIAAMNDAPPAVFALMDYWMFDGWFALQARLQSPDAPRLHKTIFPRYRIAVERSDQLPSKRPRPLFRSDRSTGVTRFSVRANGSEKRRRRLMQCSVGDKRFFSQYRSCNSLSERPSTTAKVSVI